MGIWQKPDNINSEWLLAAGLLGAVIVGGTLFIISVERQVSLGAFVTPIVILGSVPLFLHNFRGDHDLSLLAFTAICAKWIAAFAYYYLLVLAHSTGDFQMYFNVGAQLAATESFWGIFRSSMPLVSTSLLPALTGVIVWCFGPSIVTCIVLFTLVAFYGQVLFFRAYSLVYPSRGRKLAAAFLLFCPSLLYWTSTIGKDALMSLALGAVAFGFARLTTGKAHSWGFLLFGIGLAILVRPHVAALVVISIGFAYLFSSNAGQSRAPGQKIIAIPLLLALLGVALFALSVRLGSLEPESIVEKSERSYSGTQRGRSSFGQGSARPVRILLAPTLLVRPFPWEVNSVAALVSSLESAALGWILLWRRKAIRNFLQARRRQQFTLFALVYSAGLLLMLSIMMSNFGLMVRERAMMLPFVLSIVAAAWNPAVRIRVVSRARLEKGLDGPLSHGLRES
jgi:hypothetical protein